MLVPWKNFKRFFRKFLKQPGYAVSVAQRRLRAYLSYFWGKGKSSYPEAVTLFLTHCCNLRCKMCCQWGEGGVTKSKDADIVASHMSIDEYKRLIDDLEGFSPNITLFGGEPLLYPQCVSLIQYIKEKGMHCLMITNGSLLEHYAEALIGAGLDELNVSLDGGRELHDEIRGMAGLFDKITSGIKKVNQIKQSQGKKKPLINLQCTITKFNYRHLEQLVEVAREVGADSLTYHNLIFLGKDLLEKQKKYDESLNASSKDWEGFMFSPDIDPQELYGKIQDIMCGHYDFNVDVYPNFSLKGLKEYYENPSYLPSEYPRRCISPWIVAYVFPDGQMKPCLNSTFSYGNIKEEKFTVLWNNERAVKFRSLLKQNNVFPVCVRCTELYRY